MSSSQERPLKPLLFTSIVTMALTTIHHAYGAVIYDAPFRLHVAVLALPVILLLLVSYRIHGKNPISRPGNAALWIFIVTALIVPVGMIGLFEGGYNHLLKNVLYFSDTSPSILDQLFPSLAYEMPNDFWFEATGISQIITAIPGIYYLLIFSKKSMTDIRHNSI